MKVKLLVIISNYEKKIENILKKHKLYYNIITYGTGTASKSLLTFFGLDEVKKNIVFSLIPSNLEKIVFDDLVNKLQIKEIGKGVIFSISLTSSNKFILDSFKLKGDSIMNDNISSNKYELVISIVKEGYSTLVMQAAKRVGCNGGTLIESRSLGSSRKILMNFNIYEERDIVLNIVNINIKKAVMEEITKEVGINTNAGGIVLSIPIDNIIGLQEECQIKI